MTRTKGKKVTIGIGLALLVLQASGIQPAAAGDAGPRHVRAIWNADPASQATIAWTTDQQGVSHQVRYKAAGDAQWTTVDCQRTEQFNGKTTRDEAPFAHLTQLSALQPGTKYHIVCASDGVDSREFYFVTAPDDDRPIALLFGGDSRSGLDARQDVNRMMARLVAEQSAAGRPEVLALAHGGDFIVNGPDLDQWLVWLDHHELTTGTDGRLLPVIPTRGNHDMGPVFNQVFDFPKDDENYFAMSLGSEVRLATLNTETSTAGDQRDWLASELAANRWNHRWYVCQYHKPAFPAVKVPSGALTNWVPLFEEYQVDLACEADGHVAKRTPPIKNLAVDPTGVVYIGEGGLGVGQRTPKTHRWYLQQTAEACGSVHHLHLLTFHADRIEGRVIELGGRVFDEFSIAAKRSVASAAPAP